MGQFIWDGTHNSTLWEPGRCNVLWVLHGCFFYDVYGWGSWDYNTRKGALCVFVQYSTLYSIYGGRAPRMKGIEDGWTDIVLSLLSTQTHGRIGSVAARGSVGPIEFPSLM